MEEHARVFTSSSERTAWSITARHLARGQKDPVLMVLEGIELERTRCIELLAAAGIPTAQIPAYLTDPDYEW